MFQNSLLQYSNTAKAQRNAIEYLGNNALLTRSTNKNKKYSIYDPINKKLVSFGAMGYEDYTKHKDKKRRENYIKRASKIKGGWKDNKYSANNLSLKILWE